MEVENVLHSYTFRQNTQRQKLSTTEYYFRDGFPLPFSSKEQSICNALLPKFLLHLPNLSTFAKVLQCPAYTNPYFGVYPKKCFL